MSVAFDVKDFIKWREVLSDLDEQTAIFARNIDYLKAARFPTREMESQRRELLSRGLTLNNRLVQLQSALSSVREFMMQFKQKDETQLASFPLLPLFGLVGLGGVIILVGELTKFNEVIASVRLAEIAYVEGGGSIIDVSQPNKTAQNLKSFALIVSLLFGGFFLLRTYK